MAGLISEGVYGMQHVYSGSTHYQLPPQTLPETD